MRLIEIYHCLCDETRLRIMHLLAQAPLCVCHLQEVLGLSQVATSKHLAYLRKRGLVVARRQGQWVIYSLPPGPPRELEWQLRCLADCREAHPLLAADLRTFQTIRFDCERRSEGLATAPRSPSSSRHRRVPPTTRTSR
ncbi:MAG TPA: ArsR family transcriptional regulator [Verrucomicrobiales bacterium]|nr:ArsR family transcriptional regulator [Verrucomicrobiales bacterium]